MGDSGGNEQLFKIILEQLGDVKRANETMMLQLSDVRQLVGGMHQNEINLFKAVEDVKTCQRQDAARISALELQPGRDSIKKGWAIFVAALGLIEAVVAAIIISRF